MIRYSVEPARPQAPLKTTPFHRYEFPDGTIWTEFHRLDTGYLLRFPDLADFQVSDDGSDVIAFPLAGVDENTVEHLYVNQLVPLALSRQGRPAFHASVVTVPGGSVAFLGQSGAGKSTLAASFALDDAAFLTDDALIVEESNGDCLALPSHASVRLWEDSRDALVKPGVLKSDAVSYSSKTRLLAGEGLRYCDQPRPLRAAFVLLAKDSPAVSIRDMSGLERYMAWLNNSFLLDIEDRDLLAQHFEWTHRISSSVPTFGLDYPRDYGILPDVRESVLQHIGDQEWRA